MKHKRKQALLQGVLILLLSACCAFAFDPSAVRSKGKLNGRFWVSMSETQKMTFLWGVLDEYGNVVLVAYSDGMVSYGRP